MNPFKIIIIVLILAATSHAANWYKIEGQYSYVEYEQDLSQTADSLLIISETWIPRLCAVSGQDIASFKKKKARIILTDAPDITNGYAIGNDIVIYALSSGYVPNWSGEDSWYETVLKHELVHQIIYRATEREINHLGAIAALSVPRWFHEGLAQYYAETWNTFRGDLTLQSALLDGKLNYGSLSNLNDGLLLYSSAHAFVRYLADQFGDSSFVKLLSHESNNWTYEFYQAFQTVYGKSEQEVFSDFFRYLVIYYGDKLADYPDLIQSDKLPHPGFRTLQIIPFGDQDSTYLASIQINASHKFTSALIFQINEGKSKILKNLSTNYSTPLVCDADRQLIAWGRRNYGVKADQNSLDYRWFIFDLPSDKTIEVPKTLRCRYASFGSTNNLILSEVNHNGAILWSFDLKDLKLTRIFKTNMPVGKLDVFPDGSIVFDAQDANRHKNLYILHNGYLTKLTDDSLMNDRPVIINDSLFAFNRTQNNRPALAIYNLNNHDFNVIIDAAHSVLPVGFNQKNQNLLISVLDHYQSPGLRSIALDSLISQTNISLNIDINPKFSRWTKVSPDYSETIPKDDNEIQKSKPEPISFPQKKLMHGFTFGLPLYDSDLGIGLFATSTWMESLQRQALQLNGVLFQKGWDESLLAISHYIRAFDLTFNSLYYHGPAIFSIADGRRLKTFQDILSLNISRNINIKGNTRSIVTPAINYAYYHYNIKEKQPDFPANYKFHGPSASLRYRYVLPTTHYPALPKRLFSLRMNYFSSLSPSYLFNILQTDISLGSNLLWERLGFISKGSLISSAGNMPPLNRVGIDRFYELDVPRDVTYTRTVRGVRQDIQSPALLWSSNELNLILVDNSGMKLLFIPINKMLVTGFYDYARFELDGQDEVSSYGVEVNGVWSALKFGVGYAKARFLDGANNEELYWRIGILLPGFY